MYQVVAVAEHTETGEKLVVYQALYGDFKVYARPLAMFLSEVDHEKYPEVKQRYRFERVELPAAGTEIPEPAAPEAPTPETETPENAVPEETPPEQDEGGAVDPRLMEFLDADSYEEKYNILVSMRNVITDKMIDDIAVVMDVVIPEGETMKRYDALRQSILTRQKYEFANRLR
jgi:hypothetical protein